MFDYIQKKYDFTDYQTAQLQFLWKSSLSELSKIIVLALLFHNQIMDFLVAALLLCSLRIFSGGIHCKTYLGCLITSVGFFVLILKIANPITLPHTLEFILLLLCILIGYYISPITAKCRIQLENKVIAYCRGIYITLLFLFVIALYIFPQNPHLHIGFWVIIFQTLQLIVAKILQKGEQA